VKNPKETIMARARADILLEWEKLRAAYKANAPALSGFEPLLQELETVETEVRTLGIEQDVQQAAVQQTAKEIEGRIARGTVLATRLRSAAKAVYGTRTEKMLEFGIRPFRKRVRAPKIVFIQKEPETSPQESTPRLPQTAKPTT
jgi:hypothetical protein